MSEQQYQALCNTVYLFANHMDRRALTEYEMLCYESACRLLQSYNDLLRRIAEASVPEEAGQ